MTTHNDLILKDASGNLVYDTEWNELMFDIRTADKRTRLLAIVQTWIQRCADSEFQAVEIDNLDTYSRSNNLISK